MPRVTNTQEEMTVDDRTSHEVRVDGCSDDLRGRSWRHLLGRWLSLPEGGTFSL